MSEAVWYPDDSGEWVEVVDGKRPLGLFDDDVIEVLRNRERMLRCEDPAIKPVEKWPWGQLAHKTIVAYKLVHKAEAPKPEAPKPEAPKPEAPKPEATQQTALSRQEGGDHYKDMAIQPFEYIHANKIGFAAGCVIKYVSRWEKKNGVEDLKKARHFLDLLIEAEQAR